MDYYIFDAQKDAALSTWFIVGKAYSDFFIATRNPLLTAEADAIPRKKLQNALPLEARVRYKAFFTLGVGHACYLGTKYSEFLDLKIFKDTLHFEGRLLTEDTPMAYVEMKCHGVCASRVVAALANSIAGSKSLNWPRGTAPFEAVVIRAPTIEKDAVNVLDQLSYVQVRIEYTEC
ncbi:hypothetical protein MMC17_005718 [Xylographa soralifera]|nr:hypothetical protein [Xylographa soralifera]